jgi:hypothetical protein
MPFMRLLIDLINLKLVGYDIVCAADEGKCVQQ